jgi:hypothetical protein
MNACGNLVIAANNRPFSTTDIEHILCKVYVGLSKTLPGRSNSLRPRSSKPGYHPTFVESVSPSPEHGHIASIMLDILDEYKKAVQNGTIRRTPTEFLIRDEPDPLLR